MSSKIPFTLVTAFTNRSSGGNPAAVVFVDTSTATETLSNIAKNLAQPIAAFVGPKPLPSDDETVATFDIRWFTGYGFEVPLCGHGLLASARVVSERSDLVSEKVKTYAFNTLTSGVVKAVKLEDGYFQIFLPSTIPQTVSSEERARLLPYIVKAFGRDVVVNEIAVGQEGFTPYLLVELDEKENLKDSVVDADALRGHGYVVNVITTDSNSGKEHFVMRMFAPGMLAGGEDHVCGSAHCLLGPYWSGKKGIIAGTELKSTQVSPRGGDLWLVWDEKEKVIRLKGQLFIFATGDLVWSL